MKINTWVPDVIIYHDPCSDGFGAAWVAHRFESLYEGFSFDFVPGSYGQSPDFDRLTHKNVMLVDFSYKYDVLMELAKRTNTLTILDHHIAAKNDLERLSSFNGQNNDLLQVFQQQFNNKLPRAVAHFDMDKSGAVLMWNYLFGRLDEPPKLIQYVQDRDLWRNKGVGDLPHSQAINAYIRSQPMTFKSWDYIHNQMSLNFDKIVEYGEIILYNNSILCDEIVKTAVMIDFRGFQVPITTCPKQLNSEVGHKLLIKHEHVPFSITYCDRADGIREFSFRSREGGFDVSQLAVKLGGGGHKPAAGFSTAIKTYGFEDLL